jgi:hypothetical protein
MQGLIHSARRFWRAQAGWLLLIAAACNSSEPTGSATAVDVFAPALRAATAAREQTLRSARTGLRFDDGTQVTNCETYLAAKGTGAAPSEEVANQLVVSEYLVCDALNALSRASAPKSKAATDRGRQLAERLDLRTFASSLGPRLDDAAHTVATLGDPVSIEDNEVIKEDESWAFRLEVIAESDFNGDTKPDWLVWLSDEARDGSYRGYQTLLVSDVTKEGGLAAVPYVPPGKQ